MKIEGRSEGSAERLASRRGVKTEPHIKKTAERLHRSLQQGVELPSPHEGQIPY